MQQVHSAHANDSPAAFTLPPTVTLERASSSRSHWGQVMTMHEKRSNTIPHWAADCGLRGLWQQIRGSSGDNDPLQEFWLEAKLSPVIVNCCSYIVNLDDTFTQAGNFASSRRQKNLMRKGFFFLG